MIKRKREEQVLVPQQIAAISGHLRPYINHRTSSSGISDISKISKVIFRLFHFVALKARQLHKTCFLLSISSSSLHILQLSGLILSHLLVIDQRHVITPMLCRKFRLLIPSINFVFWNAHFWPNCSWNPAVFNTSHALIAGLFII